MLSGRWNPHDITGLHEVPYHAARNTALKSAPPLAKLFTSAIGPGAAVTSRAILSEAAPGSGSTSPATGGTCRARPHSNAATHAAPPDAPNSPSAPLIEVTTVLAPPNSSVSAAASTAS